MPKNLFILIFLVLLSACNAKKNAQSTPAPSEALKVESTIEQKAKDTLAAKTSKEDALTGELHTATITTTTIDSLEHFFVDGMGLTMEKIEVDAETKSLQRKLWDIPQDIDWETYRFHRPEVAGLMQLRVLVVNQETPSIHKSWNSRELGPFSLGFPNGDQASLDKHIRSLGFGAMENMQGGQIPRGDGTTYGYLETIFKAPEFLHCVGIERQDGVPQLAPINEETKEGGPGYSAMVLKDSDAFLAFLTDVLGLELRADRHWKSSEGGALGIAAGVPFRFSLVYSQGAAKNHLLFLDYEDGKYIEIDVAPKVPNQGLGMWTFETKDIKQIQDKANEKGITIVHAPLSYHDPILGTRTVMTLLAPNGFLVEIFMK